MYESVSESQLWASLHERLAGTPGAHELAELQRRVTPLFSLAAELPAEGMSRYDYIADEADE